MTNIERLTRAINATADPRRTMKALSALTAIAVQDDTIITSREAIVYAVADIWPDAFTSEVERFLHTIERFSGDPSNFEDEEA